MRGKLDTHATPHRSNVRPEPGSPEFLRRKAQAYDTLIARVLAWDIPQPDAAQQQPHPTDEQRH